MASTPVKIDAFDSSKISLELWLSLLEAHFAHLGITEESKKKNGLLVSVGTETYSVLGNLCAPDLPHTKSYDALVSALKGHYDVKPSYHRSLLAFQQRTKRTGETLNVLFADLKALAKDCNFGVQFDPRVRDQLFMAVEHEIYFPNLVAENLDLQKMTSSKIFERILNLEKAFVSERSEPSLGKAMSVKPQKYRCRHCGFPHDSSQCRFKDLTCDRCQKKGHLKRVCTAVKRGGSGENKGKVQAKSDSGKDRSGSYKSRSQPRCVKSVDDPEGSVSSEEGESNLASVKEHIRVVKAEEYFFRVNGRQVPFEIDSGASVSTLSRHWAKLLELKVEPSSKRLNAYDNSTIQVLGKTDAPVCYNGCESSQCFYVVDSLNNNLCGKDLMDKVGIYLAGLDKDSRVSQVVDAEGILTKYSVDHSKPVLGVTAKIHVKQDVSPKFVKARSVPFYYKEMVETALDKMVKEEVLEPVSYSEWAAPIVPVLKADQKSIRICGDFKELNKQIQCDRYPLPKIEELLSIIGNSKIFSKIDLQNAYLQVPVDEKSQDFLVINTHKGLFKYRRLPFGLSSSPGIFQKFISQLLTQIEGVAAYLDDIIICGGNKAEHDERLLKVLQVLQDHNVRINKGKSMLHVKSMEYLGYHVSGEGISPSPKKIKAILDAPAPTSVAEVQSFLGMITYYCKFVRNFSSKLAPLYDLLKKGVKFRWTAVEEGVFQDIKDDLRNSTLLTSFDGESPLIVEVDASPAGVGCVLLQNKQGIEKPVYFASKRLSPAEKNYSQIDREGLALVFALKRFRYFLLGRPFLARTDHKPLIGLFGKGRPVPHNANSRIQRWALLLSQYDYDLVHKAGKDNVVADALSRLPIRDDFESVNPAEYVKLVESLNFEDISFHTVRKLTKRDPVLSQLSNCLKFGWTNEAKNLLVDYASVKADLSLHNDVILYRNRVLMPVDLRCKVLEHLHVGHNGINAMKAEARNWVWWPKMDQDIEEVTKCCDICFKNYSTPASPVLAWPSAGTPWSRLHVDYAGPLENKYFLVIVDAYSKFLDVHVTSSITSAATIELLRKSFSNYGLPDIVVSDNASCFVSQEMQQFLQKNGVKHVTPAPYNPASNGLAERSVRSLKEGLRKFQKGSLSTRLCRFLYNQRKTVHSATGRSPAEVMFNRNFKTTIESVKTNATKERDLVQLSNQVFHDESKLFKLGDAVFVRNYGKGDAWVKGEVVEVLGLRNYKVQVQDFGNMLWKRHADQIMHRYLMTAGQDKSEGDCSTNVPPRNSSFPAREIDSSSPVGSADSYDSGSREVSELQDLNVTGQSVTDPDTCEKASVPQTPVLRRSGRVVKPPDRLNL